MAAMANLLNSPSLDEGWLQAVHRCRNLFYRIMVERLQLSLSRNVLRLER